MFGKLFDNIKIGVKIIGCFAIIFVAVTAMMLYSAKVRKDVVRNVDSMYKRYVVDIRQIGDLKNTMEQLDRDAYRYINVVSERRDVLERMEKSIVSVQQTVDFLKGRSLSSEEGTLLSVFETAWPELQRGYSDLVKAANSGQNDEIGRLLAQGSYFTEARKNIMTSLDGISEGIIKGESAFIQATIKKTGGWSGILWLISFFAAVILVGMAIMMTDSITNPLKKGVLLMQDMSRGHLSGRMGIQRKDEIGMLAGAMDNFADHLQKNVIYNIQQISEGNVDVKPPVIDDRDEIGPALNRMVDAIGSMSKEVRKCCDASLEGNLLNRADIRPFRGEYQQIIKGLNDTLDAVMAPLAEASEVLVKMAHKDLSARLILEYKGFYNEIKRTINAVGRNLDNAIQQMAVGSEQVASASIQVSNSGQSLSQGASEQASSLEEISSSLQEMSSMIKQNSMNAREAKGVSEHARSSADRGMESIERMSFAINQIKSSSDSTAKIVRTIDEIAFQTNLLALNAAVEAARAGEAGKGFAVVAEEVRNLAMRSAEAAKDTANLIENAVRNSENGVAISTEVLKNFQDIADKTNKVSQVIAEIAAASEQQDEGIRQLNRAVEQLNQVTQQNAASAEESASAAQQLSSQSEEMRRMVEGFKLTQRAEIIYESQRVSPQGHLPYHTDMPGKGRKASMGLQPDPSKVIPLDNRDQDLLRTF